MRYRFRNDHGFRHPGRNVAMAGTMALAGALAVWSGASDMQALGEETGSTSMRIGVGLLMLLMGLLFLANFLRLLFMFRHARSSANQIARWRVSADEFRQFLSGDEARSGMESNNFKPSDRAAREGFEVIFTDNGVLLDDCLFILSRHGVHAYRDSRLRMQEPPFLEFGMTVQLSRAAERRADADRAVSSLRVPVGAGAVRDAQRVDAHFSRMLHGGAADRHDQARRVLRAALVVAALCAVISAAGFALAPHNSELAQVPLALALCGLIFGAAALVLACVNWVSLRGAR